MASARPLVAANWKMHKTIGETARLPRALRRRARRARGGRRGRRPPFTSLPAAVERARRSPVRVVGPERPRGRRGRFTGEVSIPMLAELGRRRRDRRPLRAPPALRRDRRGAGAQGAGAARRRHASRSSASARPRPSATPARPRPCCAASSRPTSPSVDASRPRAARDRLRADLGDRHRAHGDARAGRGGDRASSASCSRPATPTRRPRSGSSTAAR